MAGPISDFVVALGNDGRITSQGSVADALAHNKALVEELKRDRKAVELDETEEATETQQTDNKKGKLIVAEEIAIGRVSWKACECT